MFTFNLILYQLILLTDFYVFIRTVLMHNFSKIIGITIDGYGSLNVDNEDVKINFRFELKNKSYFFLKKKELSHN